MWQPQRVICEIFSNDNLICASKDGFRLFMPLIFIRYISPGSKTLPIVEREYVLQVLEKTQWKISGTNSTAEILGIDRSTLRARMRKLNIEKS